MHSVFDLLDGGDSGGFFSFGGGGHRRGPRKAQSTAHPLSLSLEDLYKGKTTKIQITRKIICKSCNGAGGKNGAAADCGKCSGRGKVMATRMMGPGMISQSVQVCPECRGEGSVIADKDKCDKCKGNKTITDKETIPVEVKPGMRDGQKIVFHGKGDQEVGVEPGDVVLVIQCKEHETFSRKGDDLFMQKKISLAEALCGYGFGLTHLDGRKLFIQTEPGEVIKPESVKGVIGEGMPASHSTEHGNLYIVFDVQMPANHYFEKDELYKKLEQALPPKPLIKACGEEVSLHEFEEHRYNNQSSGRREAYHGDDSDDEMMGGHRGHGVQCAQQ